MFTRILLLSLIVGSWPGWAAGGDLSVVAGEPALIGVLRDAMHAQGAEFPHGAMQLIAETGYENTGRFDCKVEALVRWDGDDCYLNGTVTTFTAEQQPASNPFEVSYNKERRISYTPVSRRLRYTLVKPGVFGPLTRLRPDEWWYGNTDGEGLTWSKLLDDLPQHPPESLSRCRVAHLAGDQVELSRARGSGNFAGSLRMVFDLAQGGNVLHHEYYDPMSGVRYQSDYTWARAAGGGWYPRTALVRVLLPGDAKSRADVLYHRYEVLHFDPARPARSFFADAMIRPRPGTVVDNEKTGKKYRLGDIEPEDVVKTLDGLIETAKGRGFGARP